MNSKHMMTMACAVALCGSVLADTNETVNAEAAAGWNWAMGEGVAFEETPIVSAEVSLAFDSKFLNYGLTMFLIFACRQRRGGVTGNASPPICLTSTGMTKKGSSATLSTQG